MKDLVPYVKLSKKAEEKCLDMLVTANVMLKKWAEFYGARKAREFRAKLFKGHRDKAVMAQLEEKIPANLHPCFRSERQFIIAIHVAEQPDLGNRTVEFAMLCGFAGLARKHAKRWFAQNGEGGGMSMSDYLSEAYIAVLDSIYGYTDRSITFGSFAWASLKNRMQTATNKCNLLCPLTNVDLELLARFESAKKTFNEHVTFDQVTEAMGLDAEQTKTLGSIMAKVLAASQIAPTDTDGSNDDRSGDYTSLRLGLDNESEDDRLLKMNVWTAISKAGLTEFERQVLETSMEPYYGWQSDIAKNSINPNTNQPYTRAWVGLVLTAAQEKVRKALERIAA